MVDADYNFDRAQFRTAFMVARYLSLVVRPLLHCSAIGQRAVNGMHHSLTAGSCQPAMTRIRVHRS